MKAPQFVVVAAFLAIAVDHAMSAGGFATKGQLGGYTQHGDLLGLSEEEQKLYADAADRAVALMNENQKENSAAEIKLQHLVSVSTQVVAGTNYKMRLELIKNGQTVNCQVVVTNLYPWDHGGTWSVQATRQDDPCADVAPMDKGTKGRKTQGHLLGGEETVDEIDQDYVKKAAEFAVERINQMSNSISLQKLKKIMNVKKQVVNGFMYHITLTTVPTECLKNQEMEGKTLMDCSEDYQLGGKSQSCDVSVLDMRGVLSMKGEPRCTALKTDGISDNVLIGGDGHDLKPHGNLVIGGGDHDYRPHSGNLIGGGDHDYRPHFPNGGLNHLIGGGSHDYIPHSKSKNAIGGDENTPHVQPRSLLGSGDHDYLPHGLMSMLLKRNTETPVSEISNVHHMSIPSHDDVPKIGSDCLEFLTEFKTFKMTYRKLYAQPQEEYHRFGVFCDNMKKLKTWEQEQKLGSAKYGATQFADLTEEEFSKQYLGLRPMSQSTELPQAKIPEGPIPDSWDWRDHDAVTPVKNQGSCGSCWAFSTTGNIEGQYALKHKKLLSLSEQELVSCDKIDEGCDGGLPSNAYEAIMKLGGLETESDYKYDGSDEKCTFDKSKVAVTLSGAVNISQNEDDMAAWLYHNGPISIGINAFAMQFYFGGIAHPWKLFCNPKSLDHGVLIVGYGKDGNEPYWIVKNSWGPSWGREGYYYVYRGDGTCGLNTMCTSATVQ